MCSHTRTQTHTHLFVLPNNWKLMLYQLHECRKVRVTRKMCSNCAVQNLLSVCLQLVFHIRSVCIRKHRTNPSVIHRYVLFFVLFGTISQPILISIYRSLSCLLLLDQAVVVWHCVMVAICFVRFCFNSFHLKFICIRNKANIHNEAARLN